MSTYHCLLYIVMDEQLSYFINIYLMSCKSWTAVSKQNKIFKMKNIRIVSISIQN